MNKIIAFIMVILVFALLLLSLTPLIFISTYVLTGCEKESFITILQQIPADRFWLVGLPIFVMCYASTTYLLYRFFKLGKNNPKLQFRKKIIYRLEDNDINEKLRELMSNAKTKNKS
jgi:hypothetical protein